MAASHTSLLEEKLSEAFFTHVNYLKNNASLGALPSLHRLLLLIEESKEGPKKKYALNQLEKVFLFAEKLKVTEESKIYFCRALCLGLFSARIHLYNNINDFDKRERRFLPPIYVNFSEVNLFFDFKRDIKHQIAELEKVALTAISPSSPLLDSMLQTAPDDAWGETAVDAKQADTIDALGGTTVDVKKGLHFLTQSSFRMELLAELYLRANTLTTIPAAIIDKFEKMLAVTPSPIIETILGTIWVKSEAANQREKGLYLLKSAANKEEMHAQYQLAIFLHESEQFDESLRWSKRAITSGCDSALNFLLNQFSQAIVAKDFKSQETLQTAVEMALMSSSMSFKSREIDVIKMGFACYYQTDEILEQLAKKSNHVALYLLGVRSKRMDYFKRAMEGDFFPFAAVDIATTFLFQPDCLPNIPFVKNIFERLIQGNTDSVPNWARAKALYGLGCIYLRGLDPAEVNPQKGLLLLKEAAQLNSDPAVEVLASHPHPEQDEWSLRLALSNNHEHQQRYIKKYSDLFWVNENIIVHIHAGRWKIEEIMTNNDEALNFFHQQPVRLIYCDTNRAKHLFNKFYTFEKGILTEIDTVNMPVFHIPHPPFSVTHKKLLLNELGLSAHDLGYVMEKFGIQGPNPAEPLNATRLHYFYFLLRLNPNLFLNLFLGNGSVLARTNPECFLNTANFLTNTGSIFSRQFWLSGYFSLVKHQSYKTIGITFNDAEINNFLNNKSDNIPHLCKVMEAWLSDSDSDTTQTCIVELKRRPQIREAMCFDFVGKLKPEIQAHYVQAGFYQPLTEVKAEMNPEHEWEEVIYRGQLTSFGKLLESKKTPPLAIYEILIKSLAPSDIKLSMLGLLLEKTPLKPRAQDIWSFFSIFPKYPFEEENASRFFIRVMANTELSSLEKRQVLALLLRVCKEWKFCFAYAENYLLELACYYLDRNGIYQQLTQIHHWQNKLYEISKTVYARLPFHTGIERLFDVYAHILMQLTQFPHSVCNLVTEYMVSNKKMVDVLLGVIVDDFEMRKTKIDLLSAFQIMSDFLQFLFTEKNQLSLKLTTWKSIDQPNLQLTFENIKDLCTEEKLFSQIKVIVDFFIHSLKGKANDKDLHLHPEQIQIVAQTLPLLFLEIEDLKQEHFTLDLSANLSNPHIASGEQKHNNGKRSERRRPTRAKPVLGRFISDESAVAGSKGGSEIPGFSFGTESTSFFSQSNFASFGAIPTEFSFGGAAAVVKDDNYSGSGPGPAG